VLYEYGFNGEEVELWLGHDFEERTFWRLREVSIIQGPAEIPDDFAKQL